MDLLRWPVVRALARRRHVQLALRLALLVLAALLVLHGLFGPQIAPRNMATVLGWVHYRGLLILAILAAGNLFCTACPMIAVRDAGRRLAHPALRWPRALRNKWPAITLFVTVLFTYELFDLWSLPRATAVLILAYFAVALVVDVVFAGATFCKYLCPVGQFSFLASTMAPAELRIRDVHTCQGCRTADCIKGRREAAPALAVVGFVPLPALATTVAARRVVQRGCELGLFLPGKVGNLDCTLCLDCVRACPHDNIALAARVPADELSYTGRRSGVGRLFTRADLAALALVFTFGAFVNAFAMTAPAVRLEQAIRSGTGAGDAAVLSLLFLAGLVLLPFALVGAAAVVSRRLAAAGGTAIAVRSIALRFAYALVPLGVGVWAAHYGFHALTGALTIVPVTQSAVVDATGRPLLGEPLWMLTGMAPGAVYPVQLGCLLLGAIGSMAVAHRLSQQLRPARSGAVALPWAALIVALALAATWILGQPMEMRGVGMTG